MIQTKRPRNAQRSTFAIPGDSLGPMLAPPMSTLRGAIGLAAPREASEKGLKQCSLSIARKAVGEEAVGEEAVGGQGTARLAVDENLRAAAGSSDATS